VLGLALAAVLAASEPLAEITTPPCPVIHRQTVYLRSPFRSPDDNSNVLLWMHRDLLFDYEYGHGSVYRSVFDTKLIAPDTKAIVTSACQETTPRIIGVRILGGVHRGAFGFVDEGDVER